MLRREGDKLSLSGAVTTATYRALAEEAAAHVGTADLIVDWSAVDEVDSSAVALILAWQRESARRSVSFANTGLPASLTSLVELYSLSEIIAPSAGH